MNPKTRPEPKTQVDAKIDRELGKHTSTSIFDSRGELNEGRATALSNGNVGFGDYLHLGSIPWAPEPDGAEHCQHLAQIAEYMAALPESWGGVVGGPMDKHDQKVLHAVAMLYAVGKGSLGTQQPPLGREGYEARSAAYAEQFFRQGGGAGTYWSKTEIREDVCKLIYMHTREEEIRTDKRLQVFADAVRYELCRIGVNTAAGMALLKEHCRPDLFHSAWARDRANFRQYMLKNGWK